MKKYLEINITDSELAKIIKMKIGDSEPMSMVRYGDGEIFFLNDNISDEIKKRFCDNWGFNDVTYDEGKKEVIKILNKSLINCDYIGIMDLNNGISKKIKANNSKWGITNELIKNIGRTKEILTCDHQSTRGPLLGDVKNFKEILNGEDLHIISSRTDKLKHNNLSEKLNSKIRYTQVDYTSKLSDRGEIFKKIEGIEEKVVITSMGILGKDIPHHLAERGKICLDFGATIDAWAGIISRPWFNKGGLQNHCLIKK